MSCDEGWQMESKEVTNGLSDGIHMGALRGCIADG